MHHLCLLINEDQFALVQIKFIPNKLNHSSKNIIADLKKCHENFHGPFSLSCIHISIMHDCNHITRINECLLEKNDCVIPQKLAFLGKYKVFIQQQLSVRSTTLRFKGLEQSFHCII